MADVEFDFARPRRTGLAEAVLALGKSTEQLAEVLHLTHARGVPLLITRLDPVAHAALLDLDIPPLDYDPPSRTAIMGKLPAAEGPARVAVVTAGTSDLPVAGEAIRTLAFNGILAERFPDCGVAGLWRLLRHEDALRQFSVVIACAGMEGALFSVLGGLVGGVIIAVPTSTGYGVAEGGRTALRAALASCAPGIVTVNIDNGYGAAAAAIRVLHVETRT